MTKTQEFAAPYPNTTETMAELAWRYGEQGLPYLFRWDGRSCGFADGSIMERWQVHTARSRRHLFEVMDATAARLGGWKTTR